MADGQPCNDEEMERQRLKCVNRSCKSGESLTPATEMVCRYYGVTYEDGKVVCRTCLKKSLAHYVHGERLMKKEKCVMECDFPNFDKHVVIDSSEDELEPQSDFKSSLSVDRKTSDCLGKVVELILEKNKDVIAKQVKLCDGYLNNKTKRANNMINKIDGELSNLEKEVKEMSNIVYKPHTPIINNESCVDFVDDEVGKKSKVHTIVTINETNEQIHTKDPEEDITDKDGIIAVNHTICTAPADLPREGQIKYPTLNAGDCVYGMIDNLPESWVKCIILNSITKGFSLVSFDNNQQKLMNPGALAYYYINPIRYHVGSRVISKYTDPSVNSSSKCEHFYAGIVTKPPTLLNEYRYLIFYDNGRVQYRYHKDIHLIVHKSRKVWKCVKYGDHTDAYKIFLKRYLEKYPDRHMVKLSNKHNITARSEGKWMGAKVMEVDASLVKLHFSETNKIKWLYRGSSRLLNILDKLKGLPMGQSGLEYLNKPFVEITTVQEEPKVEKFERKYLKKNGLSRSYPTAIKNVAVKSTKKWSKITSTEHIALRSHKKDKSNFKIFTIKLPNNAKKPQMFVPHKCNPSCGNWTKYNDNKTKKINVLAVPAHFGFVRRTLEWDNVDSGTDDKNTISPIRIHKAVEYICPCGRTIRSMNEMLSYLMVTKSKMTIDLFDLNSWVKPMVEFKIVSFIKYFSDISSDKEFKKISCVNSFTSKRPPRMTYITSRQPMPGVNINTDHNFLCGCDCTDDCQDKSKCACWQLTIKNQNIIPLDSNEYDPNIGYHYRRLPERVITGIYECNSTCKCSKTCLNRVVQQPLSLKLQLFMTEKKGCGVRCLNDIPAGNFICTYVGYLLTENDANHRGLNYGDEYLAELDYIEVVEKTKEGYEENVLLNDIQKNIGDKDSVSETSDEGYQVPCEKASIVGSDIRSRLRKRKIGTPTTKKFKAKKDSKEVQFPSKFKARVQNLSPEPPKSVRGYFGKDEKVYIMDAKTSGNIGRYINHSCSPNLFVQNVFVDTHDIRFPWISFFALHYIPAGTELTWDYSYDIGSVPSKKMMCHCESVHCRKRLL